MESIFPSFTLNMQPFSPQPATVSTWIPHIITVPTNQAATGTFNTPSTIQPQGQPSCDASFPTTNTAPYLPYEPSVQPTIVIPSPDIQPTTYVLSSNTQQNTSIPVHKPTSQLPPLNSITTRAKNNIRKPIQKLNLSTQLSHPIDVEPTTVTQALKDPKWRRAMFEEYDVLVQNGT